MSDVTPWRERLDWKGERSPSNKQRMEAMQAEIKDLRAAIKRLERQNRKIDPQSAAKLIERERAELADRINRRLAVTRRRALYWRTLTYALRKELNSQKRV